MTEPMTYRERARAVLKDYIRSVVLIDDRWPEVERQDLPPEAIDPSIIDDMPVQLEIEDDVLGPGATIDAGADELDSEGVEVLPGDAESTKYDGSEDVTVETMATTSELRDDHELLHVKTAVMGSGIIFSGVRYVAKDKERCEAARKLALRSDVLILDWNLAGNDGGEAALALLKVLRQRGSGPRFIYVFTQDSELARIGDAIRKLFEPSGSSRPSGSINFSTNGFSFAIRRKNYSPSEGFKAEGDVKPAHLIDDALDALAEAKAGLLDMALVELTTRHRWYLNSMIERIGSRYDAALIAEHAFDGSLNLTEGTIHEVLFDEWRAQLAVRPDPPFRILSDTGVDAYLKHVVVNSSLTIPTPSSEVTASASIPNKARTPEQKTAIRGFKQSLRSALEPIREKLTGFELGDNMGDVEAVGLGEWPQSIESIKGRTPTDKNHVREAACATIGFCCNESRQTNPQVEFLGLQSLLTQRRNLPERVTQGTILRLPDTSEAKAFVICTTPLCDTHTPEKICNYFTFLTAIEGDITHLNGSALDNGTAIVIEPPGEEPLVLVVRPAPIVALHIANPAISLALPEVDANAWPMPRQDAQSFKLTAVAQLRRDHAFHIAGRAIGYAGRIGLDHVEFLRDR